jgi:uncharacterized protein
MELTPFEIKLLPNLTNTGASELRQDVYQLDSLDVGARHFELKGGIDYDVNFTNTGEAILLTGYAQAELESACDRCLESVVTVINGQVEGYYLLEEPVGDPEDDSEGEFEFISKDGLIDLAPALLAAIVFELPAVVLCDPDCKGICPECGANLNIGRCDCTKHESTTPPDQDDINPNSPFAQLKDLF